ncbi:MAG: chloride channel protein [Bacillota bacterium]|nr:chloride channel protein [Bacillota bacterium]
MKREELVKNLKKEKNSIFVLLKWMLLGCGSGLLIGAIGGLFGRSISLVSAFRDENPWMLYLMPVAGILIVLAYKFDKYKTSTNLVLDGVEKGEYVPFRMAPLIILSTILTHTVGGSAGREGAALQLGGSIGGTIGKYLKLNEYDRKIMIMVGMGAAFSALFGTPLTATVFAMEVVNVGIMHYAALVPCAFAAVIARDVSAWIGCTGESFEIPTHIAFDVGAATKIIILGFCCALISMLFCWILHTAEHIFHGKFKNPFVRVLVGSAIIIGLTLLVGSRAYLGTGMHVIEEAVEGHAVPYAFLLKMIFTAVTLACGFKGGEIVPSLFVGATFGCVYGQIVGLDPSLCAACAMVATFCGMTNCPISSLFLSFEMFGFENMPFFLFAIGIGYLESGYLGLYNSQSIMFSKEKLEYINVKTNYADAHE